MATLSVASVNVFAATASVSKQASDIAQQTIIIDSHIDVPYRVHEKWVDVAKSAEDGQFDYPRAKAGGLTAPFMSIYVPASLDSSAQSTQLAHILIDSVEAMVQRDPDKFALARSVDDVKQQFKKGLISLPMGMENGSPIQGSLDNLELFYDRGIRYITLAHSQSNHISDSSYDLRRQWHGLSDFGKSLIPAMNNIGMLIDVSHVSDEAFYQAIALSKTPLIASHSSLRSFTPGFERNMDDKMVKALGKNGGVIMINFGSGFVTKEALQWRDGLTKARNALIKAEGENSQKVQNFDDTYRAEHPYPYSTLADVLDHIDHVVKLIGIDHVGIGSDFDGVGDSLPTGLKDVSQYPNLVQGLLDRGYSRADIEKVLSGNFLRVWAQVEDYAASHS
ncbi:membrane dipeptidase [Alteromonas pelagimontana]|uniref:Membrane dipeptidase n=2 Tax=Alteromonas pelagimontana TaxID=1858656 RepID=A0A6M4MHX3_9ALTE|nr:dipeptidase [Alteromonas pelagimontana]QJR82729.1 membrane dipeptidase [Alteromonas pelagimontana]